MIYNFRIKIAAFIEDIGYTVSNLIDPRFEKEQIEAMQSELDMLEGYVDNEEDYE